MGPQMVDSFKKVTYDTETIALSGLASCFSLLLEAEAKAKDTIPGQYWHCRSSITPSFHISSLNKINQTTIKALIDLKKQFLVSQK